jgi:hypothetical protein
MSTDTHSSHVIHALQICPVPVGITTTPAVTAANPVDNPLSPNVRMIPDPAAAPRVNDAIGPATNVGAVPVAVITAVQPAVPEIPSCCCSVNPVHVPAVDTRRTSNDTAVVVVLNTPISTIEPFTDAEL